LEKAQRLISYTAAKGCYTGFEYYPEDNFCSRHFLRKTFRDVKVCLAVTDAFGYCGCGMPDEVDLHHANYLNKMNSEKKMPQATG